MRDSGGTPIDLPSDYNDFKAEVLADQDEDSQGVYEVWWSANSRYPELPLSTRLAIAESVVSDLLRERRITLVLGEWMGPDQERDSVAAEAAALRDWATWVAAAGPAGGLDGRLLTRSSANAHAQRHFRKVCGEVRGVNVADEVAATGSRPGAARLATGGCRSGRVFPYRRI
jgi:hypothetical protein